MANNNNNNTATTTTTNNNNNNNNNGAKGRQKSGGASGLKFAAQRVADVSLRLHVVADKWLCDAEQLLVCEGGSHKKLKAKMHALVCESLMPMGSTLMGPLQR